MSQRPGDLSSRILSGQVFAPPDRSTHDPNSWFGPDGTFRPPDRSSMDPNSWWKNAPPATGQGTNVNVAVGPRPGSSIEQYYDQLLKLMPTQRQQGFADLGSVLGSFGTDERNNRVIRGNFQGDFDRTMMEREAAKNRMGLDAQTEFDRMSLAAGADKRAGDSDALQKLQLGGWLSQGGNASAPGGAHRAISDPERQAGGQLMSRMTEQLNSPGYQPTKFEGQWDYQPMNPNEYAKPGIMERIGSYGGAISGGLSAIDSLMGPNSFLNKIPGLNKFMGGGAGAATGTMGKFLPGVGAGIGAYDLIKNNRGVLGNIGSGAATGASIGSIIPGLGTGIGAGIGAAFGGLRSLFGGKKKQPTPPRY